MVVAFIFRSLIHFVLTFIWCEVRVQLHSVLCGYQITTTCFVEEICLSLNCHQIRSVAQLCPTLCDPMNRSTLGLPGHHQLPEFTQTHVHRVSDAIQPSHPLSSPSPAAPNSSQHHSHYILVKNQLTVELCLFLDSHFFSRGYVCLCTSTTLFWLSSFVGSFEIRTCELSNFVFLFQYWFDCSGPFVISY